MGQFITCLSGVSAMKISATYIHLFVINFVESMNLWFLCLKCPLSSSRTLSKVVPSMSWRWPSPVSGRTWAPSYHASSSPWTTRNNTCKLLQIGLQCSSQRTCTLCTHKSSVQMYLCCRGQGILMRSQAWPKTNLYVMYCLVMYTCTYTMKNKLCTFSREQKQWATTSP